VVISPNFWPPRVRCRRFVRPMSGRLAKCISGSPLSAV
jgi:hypothetical protein